MIRTHASFTFLTNAVINTGLKAFARNAKRADYVHGDYRICQESIHFLEKYITKRKVTVPLSDLKKCLEEMGNTAMDTNLLSKTTREKLSELEPGSFVMVVDGYDDQPKKKVIACMWRNRAETVNFLVGKIEIEGMRKKIEALEHESSEQAATS